jgi:diguanylate cyclase (GGDEF)-like protein
VLTESVRSRDLVSRHGGEEFMVGLPDCTATKAREIFDGVRARLDAAVTVAGLPVFTVSFGVVEAEESEELSDVIRRADAALFEAKREGRDRIVVHDFAGTPKKAPVVEPSPLGVTTEDVVPGRTGFKVRQ